MGPPHVRPSDPVRRRRYSTRVLCRKMFLLRSLPEMAMLSSAPFEVVLFLPGAIPEPKGVLGEGESAQSQARPAREPRNMIVGM